MKKKLFYGLYFLLLTCLITNTSCNSSDKKEVNQTEASEKKSGQTRETHEYLEKYNVSDTSFGYINPTFIENLTKALPPDSLESAGKEAGDQFKEVQGTSANRSQWSGYVHNAYVNGDKLYFSTPCPVPRDYYVYKTQVVSIKHIGLCGNYSQYYLVYNY